MGSGYSNDERAVRCLISASEAMLIPTPERRAAALLWCARAMQLVAEGDRSGAARETAEKMILEVVRVKQREARGGQRAGEHGDG